MASSPAQGSWQCQGKRLLQFRTSPGTGAQRIQTRAWHCADGPSPAKNTPGAARGDPGSVPSRPGTWRQQRRPPGSAASSENTTGQKYFPALQRKQGGRERGRRDEEPGRRCCDSRGGGEGTPGGSGGERSTGTFGGHLCPARPHRGTGARRCPPGSDPSSNGASWGSRCPLCVRGIPKSVLCSPHRSPKVINANYPRGEAEDQGRMCSRAQKSGCRLPCPPGHPKNLPAIPSAEGPPHPSPPVQCPPNAVPGSPRVPSPARSYLLGAFGEPRVLGSPGAGGTELRAAGKKNSRHELCRERSGGAGRGEFSASRGAGGESPPKKSPGRVGNRRPRRPRVPVSPGAPGVRCPPSAPRSGAGPAHSEFPVTFPGMGSRERSQEVELIPRPAHAFPHTRPRLRNGASPASPPPRRDGDADLGGDFREGMGEGSGVCAPVDLRVQSPHPQCRPLSHG